VIRPFEQGCGGQVSLQRGCGQSRDGRWYTDWPAMWKPEHARRGFVPATTAWQDAGTCANRRPDDGGCGDTLASGRAPLPGGGEGRHRADPRDYRQHYCKWTCTTGVMSFVAQAQGSHQDGREPRSVFISLKSSLLDPGYEGAATKNAVAGRTERRYPPAAEAGLQAEEWRTAEQWAEGQSPAPMTPQRRRRAEQASSRSSTQLCRPDCDPYGLCCTNPMRDSSCESSVVAGLHEQTHISRLQDQELARIQ